MSLLTRFLLFSVYLQAAYTMNVAYQQQWVRGQRRQLLERVFQRQSHWRKYWRNRHLLQWFYHLAFDHQVGYHVLGSTTPNTHYPSVLRLGQHVLRCIHAESRKHHKFWCNLHLYSASHSSSNTKDERPPMYLFQVELVKKYTYRRTNICDRSCTRTSAVFKPNHFLRVLMLF